MLFKARDQYIGGALAMYGEYSEGEVDLFKQVIKPTDHVVEVGSNIGALTVPLLLLAAKVYAFEPQGAIFPMLVANCLLTNKPAYIAQHAVSDFVGELDIPIIDYDGQIVNGGGLEITSDYGPDARKEHVRVITIDSLNLEQCNFIKADVEGMEEKVLRGAEQTIGRLRPILYVENDREPKSQSLCEYIYSLGYSIHPHMPRLYNPNNFNQNPYNVYGNIVSKNLLCWPQEREFPADLNL
jgi:FkbM family methyltransferase